MAGDKSEVVICDRPQGLCGLVLLPDAAAHQIRLGDTRTFHTAAFAFLTWQEGDVLGPSFMGTQHIPCQALPQGTLECEAQNNSGTKDRHVS